MASVIVTQEQAFLAGAASVGAELVEAQMDQFRAYYRELRDWNQRANLTSVTEYGEVLARHFLDSLTLLPPLRDTHTLIDIGTGAGFPGIPLAIALPELQVTLADSVRKKTAFCEHTVSRLGLSNVAVVTQRAEVLGQSPLHRERYDAAVSRAVDRLVTLAEYLLPLCRIGGQAVVMKKGELRRELADARNAVATLGANNLTVSPVTAPGLTDDRVIITIPKAFSTPTGYPRRPGMARKRPL